MHARKLCSEQVSVQDCLYPGHEKALSEAPQLASEADDSDQLALHA